MSGQQKRKHEKFLGMTSRAGAYSGVSISSDKWHAFETKFSSLGEKYPDFPFGFLLCFDTIPARFKSRTQSRINRSMNVDIHGGYYRNNTALSITIVMHDEDFPSPTTLQPDEDYKTKEIPQDNIVYANERMREELLSIFPEAVKKQAGNYPILNEIMEDFIEEFKQIVEQTL